ncbi:MAG: phenylacetate--CoA ligase family protein [Gemmatimonadetes bacterium]|nr:phenylacetate--CoA ligase family protein [Gemmatimonadota bacterium]
MSVLTRALYLAVERLRGSEALALLREIEPLRMLPPDRARALQFARLQALLEHAERRVPYYRELFADLRISSRDIRSLEDFARLPVLTKDIVRERARDLVRDDVPLSSLSEHHSGGSTGVPLTFWREPRYMSASAAGTYRNLRQAGWRPGDMVAFFWGWNDRLNRMSRVEFELRQQLRRMYQFDPFHSGLEAMDRWVRTWNRIRPRVALGYASTIARFAAHVERTGRRLRPVAGVFTTAEKLYPAQRELIHRVLGGPVFDCYGSSEVQNIATECVRGRMHVNADFVVLETDEAGRMADGTAPLLVTSLWNYAMPFIRYRNEDCGALVPGVCDCGSGFPLMELRIARVSDNFVLPNGRVVHGEFFTHLLYGSEGIESFQFHQTAMDRIVLWIVPTGEDGAARERAVRAAVAQVEALAPGLIHVEAREVASIPLSSAGKHRFTRSDVSIPADSGVRA